MIGKPLLSGFATGGTSCITVKRLPDHMVDDDGLWGHQECMQALWDLRELHSLSLKDLQKETNTFNVDGTL